MPIDLNEDNAVALIPQDNNGASNANTYVTEQELENYTTERGITLTGDYSQLLLRAMDYLESKQYKSEPLNSTQSTLFPRMGVGIARNIKQAQLMLAVAADSVDLFKATNDAQTKREKVAEIEVEYFENANAVTGSPLLQTVNELLSPYLASKTAWAANVAVYRG